MSPPVPSVVLMHRLDDNLATRSTLELLRWWQTTGRSPELVLSVHDGPMRAALAGVCPLRVVNPDDGRRPSRLLQVAGMHRPAEVVRGAELTRWLRPVGPSTLVTDLRAARLLHWRPSHGPVVGQVHAAAPDAATELDPGSHAVLVERTVGWIAGSPTASRAIAALGSAAPVAQHHDLLPVGLQHRDPARPTSAARRAATRAALEREHGIPVDAPLVVGVGQRDWWHTGNAFVEVVWRLRMRQPRLHAAWAPLGSSDRMLWPLRHDIDHAGLSGSVRVLGPTPPPMEVIAAADLVIDTEHQRRGDTSPAPPAAVDTPVVAFAPAVTDGVVETDDGWTVPFLDMGSFVDRVFAALPGGEAHRPRPELATWDVEVGGPLLHEQLTRWLA